MSAIITNTLNEIEIKEQNARDFSIEANRIKPAKRTQKNELKRSNYIHFTNEVFFAGRDAAGECVFERHFSNRI